MKLRPADWSGDTGGLGFPFINTEYSVLRTESIFFSLGGGVGLEMSSYVGTDYSVKSVGSLGRYRGFGTISICVSMPWAKVTTSLLRGCVVSAKGPGGVKSA